MNVRRSTPADVQQLLALLDKMSPQDKSFLAFNAKKDVIKQQIRHAKHIYVVEDKGKILGFARESGRPNNFIMLEDIFIDPAHRGKGVGKLLLEYITKIHPNIQMKTNAKNTAMIGLAQNQGFNKIKESPKKTMYTWERIAKTAAYYAKHKTSPEIIDRFKNDYYNLRHIRTGSGYDGLLLSRGNKFVGIVQVSKDGTIQALEVAPEFRGKGIATKLLNYAESELGANKLSVRKNNLKALNLYKKRGYVTYDENDTMLFQKLNKGANTMFRELLYDFEKQASQLTEEELDKYAKYVLDELEGYLAEQEKVAVSESFDQAAKDLLAKHKEQVDAVSNITPTDFVEGLGIIGGTALGLTGARKLRQYLKSKQAQRAAKVITEQK